MKQPLSCVFVALSSLEVIVKIHASCPRVLCVVEASLVEGKFELKERLITGEIFL